MNKKEVQHEILKALSMISSELAEDYLDNVVNTE